MLRKLLLITYNHGNGEMLIHLDYFFPCSQVRFNKLLKIIELDWQHEAELKENLKVHFQTGAKAPEWPQVKAFPWRG